MIFFLSCLIIRHSLVWSIYHFLNSFNYSHILRHRHFFSHKFYDILYPHFVIGDNITTTTTTITTITTITSIITMTTITVTTTTITTTTPITITTTTTITDIATSTYSIASIPPLTATPIQYFYY